MKSLIAYERIRDMILASEKLPGTRLVLTELEDELGIGRGPIREALMRLDRSGLVKNIPYKGAVVACPPSLRELFLIFNIRVDLEAQLTVEAMAQITPQQIEELEAIHSQMQEMGTDFYSLDRKFHKLIYSSSNLPHLCAIVDKMIESVETFLTLYRQRPEDSQKFLSEHSQILTALKAKDEELVKSAMKNNIRSGLEVVERSLSLFARQPR